MNHVKNCHKHPPAQNSSVFTPFHLNGQDVKQVEAEGVQNIGVGCGFHERRCRGDDCDHHDQSCKSGPADYQTEKKK